MIIKIKEFDVLVDDDDFDRLSEYRWSPSGTMRGRIYFITRILTENNTKKLISMHRFIMGSPLKLCIDHINGNTFDNRKENLRICSTSDNLSNQKIHSNNKSGYKGVFITKNNTWRAMIGYRGRSIYLGQFKTPELAYEAYCKASKEYHGGFSRLK